MADSLVFNTVEKLIGRLSSAAVEAWNVRDDIEKLKDTMSTIKFMLLDAEEQQGTNRQVKDWLKKLEDALNDAEDLVDDLFTEELRREVTFKGKKAKKVRIFFSSSNQVVFSFKMANKIKEVRGTLEAIDRDRKQFHFTERTTVPRVERKRETHSFIPEQDVVGRGEEKKALVDFLLNADVEQNVSIVSIVGFGGLGKTALAQLIYNDNAVDGHFDLKMWVCVSEDFDVKAIAKMILRSATNADMDQKMILRSTTNDDMDQVQQKLRKKIEGKRYLLVLDDIWNEDRELWLQLMTLLMGGGKGSKIVITTRSEKVSKLTGTSSPFILKGLDEKQSWKLFAKLAFENGREPENKKLIGIGKEIVKKCGGVPLAIRSIGSLMYSEESETDWSNFKDKELVKIDEQGDTKVFQLIKLSYDHLSFNLKKCFTFCSLFPKDSFIERKMLIRLWVAHGFVQSSDESICLEDVGNEYFMDLAHRSFFQDLKKNSISGEIECQMHDLVHDLAKFVAGDDYVIVNEKGQPIDERTRHLSFGFHLDSSWQAPSSLLSGSKLRTFLLPYDQYRMNDEELLLKEYDCHLILSNLKQLRVLDLRNLISKTLPTCIGMLKHLRYLDLSWNGQMEVLPRSITKLQNLQTLLLNYCSELRELPEDLWKLINLRHLDLSGNGQMEVLPRSITKLQNLQTLLLNHCNELRELPEDLWKLINLRHLELDSCLKLNHMPKGVGQLISLQTLSTFALNHSSRDYGGASELSGLNNLKGRIKIKGLESLRSNTAEVRAMNLMEKSHLEDLTLTWERQIDADGDEIAKDDIILQSLHPHHNVKMLRIYGFGSVTMSSSVTSLTNLIEVSINSCDRLQNLPPLHLLPHLKSLKLEYLSVLEWIDKDTRDDILPTFFPSLERLFIYELPNLQGWWKFSEEGMPGGLFKSLLSLTIAHCPNLVSVPLLQHVENVDLWNVREKMLWQTVKVSNSTLNFLDLRRINDLKSLSGVLQHLTTLRELVIRNCEELDPCNDENGDYGMQWKELKNLHELTVQGIPKMVSLPEGLQYVTNLNSLTIGDCDNLTYLPEWIASLGSSLKQLTIRQCPRLMSLPEAMRNLTSLQLLRIIECTQLEERCRGTVGEDWPKISHIPNVTFYWF